MFAGVAASRLLWAGFKSDPILISIDCLDCPEDPMTGKGARAEHSYLAIYQPQFGGLIMVDGSEENQGWRWGELDRAIDSLPAGEVRSRQRQLFDALMLAGVMLQHGDRKPEQQRLTCGGPLNLEAGDLKPAGKPDEQANSAVFFEHPGATACGSPVVAVHDMGATFGGAGKTTNASTAKMNLAAWTARPVFHSAAKVESGRVPECRGRLTVSMAAGEGSSVTHASAKLGRVFLPERLQLLTDEHLRRDSHRGSRRAHGHDHTLARPTGARSAAYRGLDGGVRRQGPADRRAPLRRVTCL